MPYIDKYRREVIWKVIDGIGTLIQTPGDPGSLNFVLTSVIKDYLAVENSGRKPNYEQYNSVMGVLACIQQELYRVQIAPYEDEKISSNGGVYANQL